MQQSDWAKEAHFWFESYHRSILNGSFRPEAFFFDLSLDDDALYRRVQGHPLLGSVNILQLSADNDFEVLEQVRGWQPLLRKLPKVPDYRLLTILRRSLLQPLDNPNNQMLVSRHQWTLMEGLRWKAGYYEQPDVLRAMKQAMKSSVTTTDTNIAQTETVDPSASLEIRQSNGTGGRHVAWVGEKEVSPGSVIWECQPVARSLVEPNQSTAFCFHCTSRRPETMLLIPDQTLLCPGCQVFSYCRRSCQEENEALHQLECAHMSKLLAYSDTIGMPKDKSILVYRAILQPDAHTDLLELESHLEDYRRAQPEFLQKATQISEWMLQEKLVTGLRVETLVHFFLVINVNAFGIGSAGVGIFTGMPSMFNHSCLPNVTHSWDDNDGRLRFRTISEIRSGDELCHAYAHELEQVTSKRTASLLPYKFFTCTCARCSSEDELGKLEACQEWQTLAVSGLGDNKKDDAIAIYQRLTILADIIFPASFITKGWAYEELGLALLQESHYADAISALEQACRQYTACQGAQSDIVQRVDNSLRDCRRQSHDGAIMKVDTHGRNSQSNGGDTVEDDDDADLILAQGWSKVLMEIKTYEPAGDWAILARDIKAQCSDSDVVQWCDGYRLYELGFGIQTLILACCIQESTKLKEQVTEEIEEAFDEIVQHMDFIVSRGDYAY